MNHTRKIVIASLMAALTCVATMAIHIPSPTQGYLNLGDCMVLCCGWLLNPFYGFCAAGIGSGLADLLSGYGLYAPATLLIKGLMALTAHGLVTLLASRKGARLISGAAAECVMVGGYLAFESILYGFAPSLLNVIPNMMQGLFGLTLGALLINFLPKQHFSNQ